METESLGIPPEANRVNLEQLFDIVKDFFSKNGQGIKIILYNVRNMEDAEELSQELLLKLWEQKNSIVVQPDKIEAYLKRTAANAALGLLRRRKTRGYGKNPEPDSVSLVSKDRSIAEVELEHDRKKIRESIERVLVKIQPYYAALLRLSYLDGIPEAGLVGLAKGSDGRVYSNLNAVHVALQRARRSFRNKSQQIRNEIMDLKSINENDKPLLELFDIDKI